MADPLDEESVLEESEETMPAKCCRLNTDLDNVFPSRRTLMRYMEDASYMTLKMVAEVMLNKEDQVMTVGVDDTTKAAGRRLYDVKTDQRLLVQENRDEHSQPATLKTSVTRVRKRQPHMT